MPRLEEGSPAQPAPPSKELGLGWAPSGEGSRGRLATSTGGGGPLGVQRPQAGAYGGALTRAGGSLLQASPPPPAGCSLDSK